jgi:hypothetical protein
MFERNFEMRSLSINIPFMVVVCRDTKWITASMTYKATNIPFYVLAMRRHFFSFSSSLREPLSSGYYMSMNGYGVLVEWKLTGEYRNAKGTNVSLQHCLSQIPNLWQEVNKTSPLVVSSLKMGPICCSETSVGRSRSQKSEDLEPTAILYRW